MMPRRKVPLNNPEPQPQFPNTPDGQLARVFKQEALNNLREQRLNEAAERLAAEATRLEALLEKVQHAEDFTSAAAAAATRAAVEAMPALLRQLHLFPGAEEAVESDDHCPGGFPDDWTAFRTFFVKYEQAEPADNRTKIRLADVIGCHRVTITRAMVWQGLAKKLWPPSRWPVQAPPRPAPAQKRKKSVTITDFETGLVAAAFFGYSLIDYVVDGKLNHILGFLKDCGIRLVQL